MSQLIILRLKNKQTKMLLLTRIGSFLAGFLRAMIAFCWILISEGRAVCRYFIMGFKTMMCLTFPKVFKAKTLASMSDDLMALVAKSVRGFEKKLCYMKHATVLWTVNISSQECKCTRYSYEYPHKWERHSYSL